jgi:hypothetical protein
MHHLARPYWLLAGSVQYLNASLLIEGGINSKGVPNRSKGGIAVHVLASRLRVKFPSRTQLLIAIFS